MSGEELTAFGRWVREQPRGTMREIELETGLAYCTVHRALTHRMSLEVAKLLSAVTRGAVKERDIKGVAIGRPSRKRSAA